jgi:hypothetical protein
MRRVFSFSFGLAVLSPAAAFAQAAGGTPAVPAPSPSPTPNPTPGSYAPTPTGQGGFTYGPNTTSPNGTIGGGNATESSAHPVTGDEEDSFDLGTGRGGGGGTVHGDENGPVLLEGPEYSPGEVPYSHIVRRGDTLWGIGGLYFQNPYQWPRIWSYNPQIRNPNWIYPGDEVHLKSEAQPGPTGMIPPSRTVPLPYQQRTLVDRRRQVPLGTIFLRDQGWIHDDADEVWGDVTGAAEDKMFLTDFDQIYLHIDKGHEVHLGQDLTLFKPLKSSAAGTIVQINGTARVNQWDPQSRVARAQVIESLGVVERGARVGPLARRFEIVPPRRNDTDVQAHVLAAIHPEEFFGGKQVIFIDKGESAGLKPGNRLFIMRRGDAWRRTLVTPSAGYRVSPDDEKPMPPMEQTPGSHKDEQNYPDEVVGELRVVSVRKDTATCLITESRVEIEPYDLAVARKGY